MYLVSIYFDEKTNRRIQQYVDKVAEKTGNTFMLDGKVPPHITVSAFETQNDAAVMEVLDSLAHNLKKGNLTWASVGQFFPYVIYMTPVLNAYLHGMAESVYKTLSAIEGVQVNTHYRPFQWLPHTTIAKKLSKEEMRIAFEVLQDSFGMFEGEVVKIGLAKPNPHRDIATWELR